MHYLTAALGGAVGAVARYWLSNLVHTLAGRNFPWATLSVNVIGSFLMGVLVMFMVERWAVAAEWRSLVLVGFLGAFTTFSTFSLETFTLLEHGEWFKALAYIAVSVIVCVFAVAAGMQLAKAF